MFSWFVPELWLAGVFAGGGGAALELAGFWAIALLAAGVDCAGAGVANV